MKTIIGILVILGVLFVTGCQTNEISSENTTIPISTLLPTEFNEGVDMSDLTTNPSPQAQKMIQLAKESLARKYKISEDQINLFSVEAMTWPDTSLGCPQAGIIYAQMITPGFQILFEAIGQSYSYHTDEIDKVILCQIRPPDNIFPTPE